MIVAQLWRMIFVIRCYLKPIYYPVPCEKHVAVSMHVDKKLNQKIPTIKSKDILQFSTIPLLLRWIRRTLKFSADVRYVGVYEFVNAFMYVSPGNNAAYQQRSLPTYN